MIRRTLRELWRQPVLGAVSVIGTTLSIYMIMMVVIMQQVKVAPFAPESNRPRLLHCTFLSVETENSQNNGGASMRMVREYYYTLTTPEAVTAYSFLVNPSSASVPGKKAITVNYRDVDADYWHVFDFKFTDGTPFTKADVESALPVAVISRSAARKLFGTDEAAGREFQLNYVTYRVCGVVKDVPAMATKAYADVWIPVSINNPLNHTALGNSEFTGPLSVTLLARDASDFPAIREEYNRKMASVSSDYPGVTVINRNRPYDQWTEGSCEIYSNEEPDVKSTRRNRLAIFAILLLIPAFTLAEMTRSRMRRRYAEIGVRRAFGCTRLSIMRDIIYENLLITLMSGAIGLLLSYLTCFIFAESLFHNGDIISSPELTISPAALLQFSTFGWALLFCFVLNLLSSGLPAWRASRINIVNALTGQIRK
ncbi:MAG: ABC transporter permease [Muribaculaceae bacterium]|nr:ABC transporter permease [Muribaculaceae bacterium]